MPRTNAALSDTRAPAPYDLDAPWVVEPPSRLTFAPERKGLLQALAELLSGLLGLRSRV